MNLETWYFSMGLNPKALRFLKGSAGRFFYLCVESSNKENWNTAHDLWTEGNRGLFAKFLAHSLKSKLGRKWEKLPSSNERWTGKSIWDLFCECLKKRLRSSTTKLPEKCVPLLSIRRTTDRYLRIMNVAFWLPKLYKDIFFDLPYDRSVNDTALFGQHMVLFASAETHPTLN